MLAHVHRRRIVIGGAIALALFVGVPSAKAVLQALTVSGQFAFVEPGGALETVLGLGVGDPFVAVAVYDDALLTGSGFEEIALDPNLHPGHSFDLSIGNPTVLLFDETDDIDFGGGAFPRLEFFDGVIDALNFLTDDFAVDGSAYRLQTGIFLSIGRRLNEDEFVDEAIGLIDFVDQERVSPD